MVVGAPEVRTVASTEVGFITFGLVDPLPVEVTSEVDVERAQAAALVRAAGIQHSTHVNIYWSPPMGQAEDKRSAPRSQPGPAS